MTKPKLITEFTIMDWKNLSIYLVLSGLIAMFLLEEWKIGGGFLAVGAIFAGIFQGPKIFMVLNRKHW